MGYQIRIKKRAIKALTKINEPYFTQIKQAIYNLQENPKPRATKN